MDFLQAVQLINITEVNKYLHINSLQQITLAYLINKTDVFYPHKVLLLNKHLLKNMHKKQK